MSVETGERLLAASEVAERFGRSEVALAKMRMNGTGPRFVKIGGTIRYRASDIEDFLEANTRSQTSGEGD
ncbi:MAG: helix-turn-helix domain-containing protein [Proteobacteria bacterium]|nr:helix-turn-helix domain-containing protein [Pseudomonadota bacterium]